MSSSHSNNNVNFIRGGKEEEIIHDLGPGTLYLVDQTPNVLLLKLKTLDNKVVQDEIKIVRDGDQSKIEWQQKEFGNRLMSVPVNGAFSIEKLVDLYLNNNDVLDSGVYTLLDAEGKAALAVLKLYTEDVYLHLTKKNQAMGMWSGSSTYNVFIKTAPDNVVQHEVTLNISQHNSSVKYGRDKAIAFTEPKNEKELMKCFIEELNKSKAIPDGNYRLVGSQERFSVGQKSADYNDGPA